MDTNHSYHDACSDPVAAAPRLHIVARRAVEGPMERVYDISASIPLEDFVVNTSTSSGRNSAVVLRWTDQDDVIAV